MGAFAFDALGDVGHRAHMALHLPVNMIGALRTARTIHRPSARCRRRVVCMRPGC
jgi:hypothetical protein